MNTVIFDSSFVTRVREALQAKCVNGEAISRTALCQELGLVAGPTPKLTRKGRKQADPETLQAVQRQHAVEQVVGALVTLGALEGFESRRGLHGGIGRVGEKPEAKVTAPKPVELPAGFVEKLSATLAKVCKPGVCVPRRDVAKAMKSPGSDTELMISAALKTGALPGFASKRGIGGGIRSIGMVGSEGAGEPEAEAPAPKRSRKNKTADATV